MATQLCVTCQVRVGRPRATVLRSVVCGPCWAAHGGSPDAGEIGPTPTATVPSWDPRDQGHWLAALRRQDWVLAIRSDGRANLLRVARLVALYVSWETLESRPTWARLLARTGLSERTVARWLQELRVRGFLAHLEHGSTPAHRPMVLAHLGEGNRAAVYGLRIPLSTEEALHRALEQLVMRLVEDLAKRAAVTDAPTRAPEHPPAVSAPAVEEPAAISGPAGVCLSELGWARHSAPLDTAGQPKPGTGGALNGSPTGLSIAFRDSSVGGFSRASKPVDNSTTRSLDPAQTQDRKTALRAGSDKGSGPDWAVTVPTSRFAMLVTSDWLRHRLSVFGQCSRKLVRHLCRPYWRAGWCNRDIVHAMDHRPGLFSQAAGVLISPERIAAPAVFIRSRLAAWCTPNGAILPGHFSARVTATQAARQLVATRHGRAAAALLRRGEHTLTAQRITDHGHTARPPASATTRAAARAAFATTQAQRARPRR
ncbi:MAG: hypothetical protein ACRDSH_08480 [Pseudonocardiaceae bacterium]